MRPAILTMVLTVFLTSPVAAICYAQCSSKLINTSWQCNYTCQFSPAKGSECMEFFSSGPSNKFNQLISTFSFDAGCVCTASGTEKSPKFDYSNTQFQCVEENDGTAFVGTLGKKGSMTGQYFDTTGNHCIYSCTKRSSSTC